MREELKKLEANIDALAKKERKDRPFLVMPVRSQVDCSTCHPRPCEEGAACPDGYSGIAARAVGQR